MDSGFRSHRRGASARLRKTFRYPSEDEADDGNALEVMDEQEQESLITSLTTQNSRRNSQFRSLLLLIPAIASIPYLLVLFFPSSPSQQRQSTAALFPLLALSSLAATTFITVKLPPTKTGLGFIDSLVTASASAGKDKGKKGKGRSGGMRVVPSLYGAAGILQQPSPLETWLPYLNVGLCVLVLLTGLVTSGGGNGVNNGVGSSSVGRVYLAALPGVIYAATVVAKVVMAGVDPEGELGGLRYGYKGA